MPPTPPWANRANIPNILNFRSFLHFRSFSIFYFFMASQKPRSHLKTFLEPVAPFSQSLGPFQATATPFIPNMTTLGMSACCPEQYISRKQTTITPPPISSTIVPPIFGTHLDFFARPWYIDIFTILYWIAIPWAS